MSKIQMLRGNRVFNVDARLAPLLERRGGYLRRDMQAQSVAKPAAKAEPDSRALEAKRAAAQAKRDAAAAAKAAPKPAKKAAKKSVAKPAAKAEPEKGATE